MAFTKVTSDGIDDNAITSTKIASGAATITRGGTGASTASGARTNLGLVIGTDVQAYDADIPTVAASQAEMEAGTEAALRSMSPLRVAQAIAALGGGDIWNAVFSNSSYAGVIDTASITPSNLSTTIILYIPFIVVKDCSIDALSMEIEGGTGHVVDLAQIAIYGPLPSSRVVSKIATSATFAVDSGYGKTVAITPVALTAGIYFYSITTNTTSLSIRRFVDNSKFINFMSGTYIVGFTGGLYGAQYGQNTVTTFPHSYPSTISVQQAAHNIDAFKFMYTVV